MKVKIDADLCTGCELCVDTCPDVFEMADDLAVVTQADVPDDLEDDTPNVIGTTAPTDPFNSGNDYGWDASDNGNYYVIYSVGPGGNGSASIADTGVVTELNCDSCIYVSNGTLKDSQP